MSLEDVEREIALAESLLAQDLSTFGGATPASGGGSSSSFTPRVASSSSPERSPPASASTPLRGAFAASAAGAQPQPQPRALQSPSSSYSGAIAADRRQEILTRLANEPSPLQAAVADPASPLVPGGPHGATRTVGGDAGRATRSAHRHSSVAGGADPSAESRIAAAEELARREREETVQRLLREHDEKKSRLTTGMAGILGAKPPSPTTERSDIQRQLDAAGDRSAHVAGVRRATNTTPQRAARRKAGARPSSASPAVLPRQTKTSMARASAARQPSPRVSGPSWEIRGDSASSTNSAPRRPSSAPRQRQAEPRSSEQRFNEAMASAASPWSSESASSVGKKYRFSREELERQARAKLDTKVDANRSVSSRGDGSEAGSRHEVVASAEHIASLAQDKKQLYSEREAARLQTEERELQQFSFKPKVQAAARDDLEDAGAASAVGDRLHGEADDKAARREILKRQAEEREIKSHPWRPKTGRAPKVGGKQNAGGGGQARRFSAPALDRNRRPLHERVGELQRQKAAYHQHLRSAHEIADANLTFVPKISDKSELIVAKLEAGEYDDSESQAAQKARTKRAERVKASLRGDDDPFEPSLNEVSAAIVAAKPEFGGSGKDFLTRQTNYDRQRRAEAAESSYADPASTECSFKPQIGELSHVLAEAKEARHGEQFLDRIARLTYADKQSNNAIKEVMQAEYYSQFNYRPSTGPAAQQARASTLDELTTNRTTRAKLAKSKHAEGRNFRKEHPFRPVINPSSARRTVHRTQGERLDVADSAALIPTINRTRKQREMKLAEQRTRGEYDELKECTFTPELCVPPRERRRSEPVAVRGLARHMEKAEMTRRKAEEQKQREEEVFYLPGGKRKPGVRLELGRKFTTPKPFSMSTNRSSVRKNRHSRDDHRNPAQVEECTFRPKTNASVSADLLHRLMHDTPVR